MAIGPTGPRSGDLQNGEALLNDAERRILDVLLGDGTPDDDGATARGGSGESRLAAAARPSPADVPQLRLFLLLRAGVENHLSGGHPPLAPGAPVEAEGD